jgi:hypothetical protein
VLRIRDKHPGSKFFHPRDEIQGQKNSSVVDPYPYLDPDPDCERRAKMTYKGTNIEKVNKLNFFNAGCSLLRAERLLL